MMEDTIENRWHLEESENYVYFMKHEFYLAEFGPLRCPMRG